MFDFVTKWLASFKVASEAKKYVEEKPTDQQTAKAQATAKKEPYIAVLDTQVNPDNIRNGFFELDWNEYFILQLKSEGYNGTTEEEIVDLWFQDLCRNIGNEAGIDMENRGSGYVTRALREDGRTEVS